MYLLSEWTVCQNDIDRTFYLLIEWMNNMPE